MRVSDVMTQNPIAVRPQDTLEHAAKLLVANRISGLPVVDDSGALVGMITEGDLIRRAELGTTGPTPGWLSEFLSPGRAAHQYVRTHGSRVHEIMTREVVSTLPDAALSEVVAIMESRHIKRLPVLKDGRLAGIVSRADLLRALSNLLPERKVPAISDAELRSRVLAEIAKHRWAPRMYVDASVTNGIVELRGAVTDDRERAGLRVIAENIPGVRGVHDRLIWMEPITGSVIDLPKEE